jgi:hypothetical protein
MRPEQLLEAIFRAERDLRDAEARLLDARDKNALANLLARATTDALALNDREEGTLRLSRLADLCAQVPGPQMVETRRCASARARRSSTSATTATPRSRAASSACSSASTPASR